MTSELKKNKQLFFLVALPRSGNTLFTSIINQNPEIVATPNSITLEIMKDLFLLLDPSLLSADMGSQLNNNHQMECCQW